MDSLSEKMERTVFGTGSISFRVGGDVCGRLKA
jgi:hypothetical protein